MGKRRAGFAGQIADMPVPELIRTVTEAGRSGVLHVQTPLGAGRLWFRDGTVLDAELGRLRKEAAVERLAQAETGSFEVVWGSVTRPPAIRTLSGDLLARLEPARRAESLERRRRLVATWRPDPPKSRPPPPPPPSPRKARRASRSRQPAPSHAAAPRRSIGSEERPQKSTGPARIGRYEVLLRIARGGMGSVYLARIVGQGGFRRLFAIKVLRDHLSRDPTYVDLLLREARIASRLHHPNIVGIVDLGTVHDQHYLVMDYVEGCTLADLLEAHPWDRPPRLVIPIILDVLTGLHAAHTTADDDGTPLGLVHCDVSPQNVLVGTNGVCRITDFGIARATSLSTQSDTAVASAEVTHGKPSYLSPERARGEPLDARADVFSAGVVLWNALTGSKLFEGDTPESILQQVLERPIPRPSEVGLRPPPCFDAIVLRALERDRSRRYHTAEEMLTDLRRVAITQDHLSPSSEVAAWVDATVGPRLELRRRAAGISKVNTSTPARISSEPEANTSRTQLLRAGPVGRQPDAARAMSRLLVLGLAAVGATMLVAIGIVRPDWLRGGIVDDYGDYVVRQPAAVGADEQPSPRSEPEVIDTDGGELRGTDADTLLPDSTLPTELTETTQGSEAEAPETTWGTAQDPRRGGPTTGAESGDIEGSMTSGSDASVDDEVLHADE